MIPFGRYKCTRLFSGETDIVLTTRYIGGIDVVPDLYIDDF
jgi:hypothetical protein